MAAALETDAGRMLEAVTTGHEPGINWSITNGEPRPDGSKSVTDGGGPLTTAVTQ